MYIQGRDPADWWAERTWFGISRSAVAWILIVVALSIAFYGLDWDYVMGHR